MQPEIKNDLDWGWISNDFAMLSRAAFPSVSAHAGPTHIKATQPVCWSAIPFDSPESVNDVTMLHSILKRTTSLTSPQFDKQWKSAWSLQIFTTNGTKATKCNRSIQVCPGVNHLHFNGPALLCVMRSLRVPRWKAFKERLALEKPTRQSVIIWTQLRSIEDGDRSKQPNSEPPRTTPEALLFFFPILAKEVRYRIAALQQRVYKEVWTCYNVCFETFILLLTKLHDLHAWPIRSWNFLWMLFLLSLDSWVDLLGLPVLFIGR